MDSRELARDVRSGVVPVHHKKVVIARQHCAPWTLHQCDTGGQWGGQWFGGSLRVSVSIDVCAWFTAKVGNRTATACDLKGTEPEPV